MKKLIVNTLLIGSLIVFSGCEKKPNTPIKPKIDNSLPVVDAKYIKMIPDITAVALEWKKIDISKAKGYHIIRADMQKDGKFKRVATINNKYTTHYLDKDLNPNSKYGYKIALHSLEGFEGVASKTVAISTLPNMKSVSLIETIDGLPRQIKILWRPHHSSRVSKYIIERTSPTQPKWKQIAVVEDRYNVEYIDDDLGDNDIYMYRIKVVTFDGIVSDSSEISRGTTKPLPTQIKKLKASEKLPRKIQLSWDKSDTKDVVSYNIYRSNSANGSFSKIHKASIKHNMFDDTISDDGKLYFYKITTVDKDGLESKIEDIKPIMGSTLDKPKMPKVTYIGIQDNKVVINWVASDDRTVAYNIYKVTKDGWSAKEKVIPNIKDLRYEDSDVVRGIEYGYSIQSIDKHGLTSAKTPESLQKLSKIAIVQQ
ncbi:MAG: hypothetical protein U9R37_06425 [Campylobacterota bacterium]|nr:hypothetical protein [Campylobacterota bacterium]